MERSRCPLMLLAAARDCKLQIVKLLAYFILTEFRSKFQAINLLQLLLMLHHMAAEQSEESRIHLTSYTYLYSQMPPIH